MRMISRNLPLPLTDVAALPRSDTASRNSREATRLWLCLWLPQLPLEVVQPPNDAAHAVLSGNRRNPVVLSVSTSAGGMGICPGMRPDAALAVVPGLGLWQRRPDLEQAALGRLAAAMMNFSPWVSVDPGGDALLLEIGGSLHLFGEPFGLLSAACSRALRQGHEVLAAVAPTARAALWLARAGKRQVVTTRTGLSRALAPLAVSLPGWPASRMRAFAAAGIRHLGDCMRLPREGLSRRFGKEVLQELDEALGRCPELRPAWHPDAHFHAGLSLPAETSSSILLLEALRRLLDRLSRWLQLRQAGVELLWLRLRQAGGQEKLLRIGLARPATSMVQVQELIAIRLAVLRLEGPVSALFLEAAASGWRADGHGELFEDGSDQDDRLPALVERLRMRLGTEAVHGLGVVADHRPERAWQAVRDVGERSAASQTPLSGTERPLWLLARPRLLALRDGRPWLYGLLTLDDEPERIETGWWEGRDLRRDYHVAHDSHGRRLWVFQERRSRRWYLHGLFG